MEGTVQTPLRKFLFSAIVVCLFLFVLGIGELIIRVQTPSKDFAKFLFFTEFKVDRWHYLSKNMNIHQLDMVMASHPHIQYIEPPEANRPPFDQVPVEFHVQNNGDGFRDQEFNVDPRKNQIVVLGDSVVFGKGVTQDERFTSLLQKQMPNTQIFNLGLQGCTAECMAKLWDQYMTKLQPEMLIIQASGNDLDLSPVPWVDVSARLAEKHVVSSACARLPNTSSARQRAALESAWLSSLEAG